MRAVLHQLTSCSRFPAFFRLAPQIFYRASDATPFELPLDSASFTGRLDSF